MSLQSIEELKSIHEIQLENLKKYIEIEKQIPPSVVSIRSNRWPKSRYLGDFHATYKTSGILEALKIFKDFKTIVPMYCGKDTFTTIAPYDTLSEEKQYNCHGPYCFMVRVHQGKEFGPSAELSFFAQIDSDKLLSVNCGLNKDRIGEYNAMTANFTMRSKGNKLTTVVINRSPNTILNAGCSHCLIYGPHEGKKQADYRYLFSAEYDDNIPGSEHVESILSLTNIAETFGEKSEE